MTSNFVSALKAEITELEAELHNDPRQRKLARLRAALAEYDPPAMISGNGSLAASGGNGSSTSLSASGALGASATLRTKEDKVKAEIAALLQQRGAVHRKEILRHLIAVGLMGHEKTPMSSLAAYLSYSKNIFDRDGGGNWSLKPIVGSLKAAE
jgi:hypothetical protein